MKILIANKFYYRRGGDCIYAMNVEELLKAHGHEVAVFAMDFPENVNTEWKKYFPSEFKMRPGHIMETLSRPFGTAEVKQKFAKLLEDFKPDVVHLNNIHTQLSPVIAEIAKQKGVKVVWTLHDYKLLCPRYDCLQNGGEVCEECFGDDKSPVKAHKCMKNSWLASQIAYKEAVKWNRQRLEAATDVFVCPSQFMADKMAQGGFSKEKLLTLCNFIDVAKCERTDGYAKGEYYCFIGRLSHEKGVKTLIEAAKQLPYKLVVIGGGPLDAELKTIATDNIEFVGFKQWNEIKELVGKARFSVIPSEWYENNPLSVIEAECLGTPVLGARIGGIPELIDDGVSGSTFISGDVASLKAQIEKMWNTSFDYEKLAKASQHRYNAEAYYEDIMKIYKK